MTTKFLELRDRMTFIPIVCVKMESDLAEESYLIARGGWAKSDILLTNIVNPSKSHIDPYWGDRTYQVAHEYIVEHWDSIKSGDVIDVEYILGETEEKKKSERLTY